MAPAYQCADCGDVERIKRACPRRLRDLEGTGLEQAQRDRPGAEPDCKRLTVPAWFLASMERGWLESHGMIDDYQRTYADAVIDAAVSDALDLARAEEAKRQAEDEAARRESGGAWRDAADKERVQRQHAMIRDIVKKRGAA